MIEWKFLAGSPEAVPLSLISETRASQKNKKNYVDMSGSGVGAGLEFITGTDNEETKTRTELEIHRSQEMLPNPGRRQSAG